MSTNKSAMAKGVENSSQNLFSNSYIFATGLCKPSLAQIKCIWPNTTNSWKYQRSKTSGCNDLEYVWRCSARKNVQIISDKMLPVLLLCTLVMQAASGANALEKPAQGFIIQTELGSNAINFHFIFIKITNKNLDEFELF